jgi:voltage-gated potassium channel
MLKDLIAWCRELYYGRSDSALLGRYVILIADVLILTYFVITTFLPFEHWIEIVDYCIAAWLLLEFVSRLLGDDDRIGFLAQPMTVIDILIIISLLLPAVLGNFAFLRVLRALRLARSYVITRKLRSRSRFFASNEEVIFSTVNLLVFIFVVTAVVYVLQAESNPSINNYIDAMYFTITTLTTTGFGDITLVGSTGRLLAVVIMVVGVALFLRLVQTIFRPTKVRYECETCGLMRHEFDAVHCKHCGKALHIRTEGTN